MTSMSGVVSLPLRSKHGEVTPHFPAVSHHCFIGPRADDTLQSWFPVPAGSEHYLQCDMGVLEEMIRQLWFAAVCQPLRSSLRYATTHDTEGPAPV